MEKRIKETAEVFKALSDPNRLIIIEMLQNGELCACELMRPITSGGAHARPRDNAVRIKNAANKREL